MTNSIDDVKKQAAFVFGNSEKAEEWLNTSLSVLRGRTPLSVPYDDGDIREIEIILNKVAEGFP